MVVSDGVLVDLDIEVLGIQPDWGLELGGAVVGAHQLLVQPLPPPLLPVVLLVVQQLDEVEGQVLVRVEQVQLLPALVRTVGAVHLQGQHHQCPLCMGGDCPEYIPLPPLLKYPRGKGHIWFISVFNTIRQTFILSSSKPFLGKHFSLSGVPPGHFKICYK